MNQSPEFKQNKNEIIVLIYASFISSPQEELDADLLSSSCQRQPTSMASSYTINRGTEA